MQTQTREENGIESYAVASTDALSVRQCYNSYQRLTNVFNLINGKATGVLDFETITQQYRGKVTESEEQQDTRERVIPCAHVELIDGN